MEARLLYSKSMILVRVEPESAGPLGMNAEQRKDKFLSGFREEQRGDMLTAFNKRSLSDILGCWFSPSMATTDGTMDVLQYVNDIIGPDHNFQDHVSNVRVLAIEVEDAIAERWKVSNLPKGHYAGIRSLNPDSEYLLPNDMPQMAKQILLLGPNEKLTEERYRQALSDLSTPTLRPQEQSLSLRQ